MLKIQTLVACLLIFALPQNAKATLTFTTSFTARAASDLTADEVQLITDAVNFWDEVIVGHRDGVSRSWNLQINTFSVPGNGRNGSRASAGPLGVFFSNVVADAETSNKKFLYSQSGVANFNVHPDVRPMSQEMVIHEIGLALGIRTLWEDNEVYTDGVNGNSNRTLLDGTPGQYIGAAALAAWREESNGNDATYVPVDLAGVSVALDAYWSESSGMSISNTTRQSLHDIGFTVVSAVPEPNAFLCVGLAGALYDQFSRRKRRRSRTVA